MNYNLEMINKKRKKLKVIYSMIAILITNNLLLPFIQKGNNKEDIISDYSVEDIRECIYSSPYLSEEEKECLYDEAFLTDILPFVNQSNDSKLRIQHRLDNPKIIGYADDDPEYGYAGGYYSTNTPEIIYIKNYDVFDSNYVDTMRHEDIHSYQVIGKYNLITEALAEIVSYEYNENAPIRNYHHAVKLVKKLMEIIGSEPVWKYSFSGDFTEIEERVRPYLTEEEYLRFLEDLEFNTHSYEDNAEKYKDLDELLKKLYKNIYNTDIENDLIISLIDRNSVFFVRYYFNPRYINQENSYYINWYHGSYETVTYQEAIDNNLIYVYSLYKEPISMDEALKIIEDNTYGVHRDIDYHSATIIMTCLTSSYNKAYFTGTINGEKYERKDIDELVQEGIIKVNYYMVDNKKLTYEDYINQNYREGSEVVFYTSEETILYEDTVYCFVPEKVYLPTIDERYKLPDENTRTLK